MSILCVGEFMFRFNEKEAIIVLILILGGICAYLLHNTYRCEKAGGVYMNSKCFKKELFIENY